MSQAPVFSREAFLRQLQQQEMDKMNDPQKRAALQSQFNYINTSMQKTGAPPTDAGMDMQRQYNAPTYAPQASTPPTSRSEAPTYSGAGGLVNRVAGAIGTAGRVMASEQNRMSAPTYGGLDSQPGALAARAALVAANAPVSDAELRAREQAFRARQQQAITTGSEGAFRADAMARRNAAVQARMDPNIRARLDQNANQERQNQATVFSRGVTNRQLSEAEAQGAHARGIQTRQQTAAEQGQSFNNQMSMRGADTAEANAAAQRSLMESQSGLLKSQAGLNDRTPQIPSKSSASNYDPAREAGLDRRAMIGAARSILSNPMANPQDVSWARSFMNRVTPQEVRDATGGPGDGEPGVDPASIPTPIQRGVDTSKLTDGNLYISPSGQVGRWNAKTQRMEPVR